MTGLDARAQGLFGLTEDQEIELGQEASAQVEQKEPVLSDPVVTDYVDRLGQSLVKKCGRNQIAYHFKVIDTADINAFALPGGYIYVNRGLLEAASNESELAGVLGHEIGHVVARHSVEQIKKLQIAGLGAGILGAILGNGRAGQIGNIATQLVATGVFLKYSREAEREADRLGARNVYDAGWDPRGMVTFFDKLAAMRQGETSKVETFFSSHPDPQERAQNVDDLIASFGSLRGLRIDTRDFHSMQQRLASLPPPPAKVAAGQPDSGTAPAPPGAPAAPADRGPDQSGYRGQDEDQRIAARYAPVFHVGLASDPRFDYPTSLDFDGDWRTENNAANASASGFRPPAHVYYWLAETETNYFIFYGLYFPVDDEAVAADRRARARDNDFEVCLVVVEKGSQAGSPTSENISRQERLALIETVQDGRLEAFLPNAGLLGAFRPAPVEEGRAILFVAPRGHRVTPYESGMERSSGARDVLLYRYGGRAEETGSYRRDEVGYDLLPLQPLWSWARQADEAHFSDVVDLGRVEVAVAGLRQRSQVRSVTLGRVGVSLRSDPRFQASRLPWGWSPEGGPPGEWFLDPAGDLSDRLRLGEEFSRTYLHHPLLEVFR